MALRALLHLASWLGARCRDSQIYLPGLSCRRNPFSSKTLCKACGKEIHSRIVVFFPNLCFHPCLKRVLLYTKWSWVLLPSCCLGKILFTPNMSPSHTGHSCFFSCSRKGLDNPNTKGVCNDFLSPQIRSHCPFLFITFPPTLQGQNISHSPSFPSIPTPALRLGSAEPHFQLQVHRIHLFLQSPSF